MPGPCLVRGFCMYYRYCVLNLLNHAADRSRTVESFHSPAWKQKSPLLKSPASWDPLNSCRHMQICRSAMSLKVGQGVEKRSSVYTVFTSSCWLHFMSGTTEDNLKVGRGSKHSWMHLLCSEIRIAFSCIFNTAPQVAVSRKRKLELDSWTPKQLMLSCSLVPPSWLQGTGQERTFSR